MTFKPSVLFRLWPAAIALAVPAVAWGWQAQPAPPAQPRPVIVVQPPAHARFQRIAREHEVRDRMQKNQVEEQLRQHRMEATRRPYATDALHATRLEQAERTQRELYRARQQDLLDRYQSAVAPPVVHSGRVPASPRSGD